MDETENPGEMEKKANKVRRAFKASKGPKVRRVFRASRVLKGLKACLLIR